MMRRSLRDRLLSRLEPELNTGCWLWSGPLYPYGMIGVGPRKGIGPRKQATHRVAWRLFRGEIPDGINVLHRCDTPACCNPDHLFLGTQAANVADMIAKGRRVIAFAPKKLTAERVKIIKQHLARGDSMASIGRQQGIALQTVSAIARGKAWRHVPFPNLTEMREAALALRTPERRLLRRGSSNANAHLSEADALAIRSSTLRTKVLSERYGIRPGAVRNIRAGRSWRHLERQASAQ